MRMKKLKPTFLGAAFLLLSAASLAGDHGAQLPKVLSSAYIGISSGYLNTPFSNKNLQNGFTASSITHPHAAARVTIGTQLNPKLALQISLLRPIKWVHYNNIKGEGGHHSVWLSIFGVTVKPSFDISPRLQVYGEVGPALISRHGFEVDNKTALPDVNAWNVMLGGGVAYRFKPHWSVSIGDLYLPSLSSKHQPSAWYIYGEVQYHLHALSASRVAEASANNDLFPQNFVYANLSFDSWGFGPMKVVSAKYFPIFFRGNVRMRRGYGLGYERMVFHTNKRFSLNVGSSVQYWQSQKNNSDVVTLSVYPEFRFWLLHRRRFAWYVNYSIAGPAFISRALIDNTAMGRHFTFQDYLGTGIMFGNQYQYTLGLKVIHYSNGNLFPQNPGIESPLTLSLGMAF
jgi:hypothetical protein